MHGDRDLRAVCE